MKVKEALVKMDGLFAGMYEVNVRGEHPSIVPDKLLRAMLLQIFFSVRSWSTVTMYGSR